MSQKVLDYLATYRTFKAAERKMEELSKRVVSAAEALKEWRKLAHDKISHGVQRFDLGTLPEGRSVYDALEAYIASQLKLTAAWNLVDKAERTGLAEPPDLQGKPTRL